MKIERMTPSAPRGRLWAWIRARVGGRLVALEVPQGYGHVYGLYIPGTQPGFWARAFDRTGDPVAVVGSESIEVFHPQWFSDIEDLIRLYEAEFARANVRLIYWEGA